MKLNSFSYECRHVFPRSGSNSQTRKLRNISCPARCRSLIIDRVLSLHLFPYCGVAAGVAVGDGVACCGEACGVGLITGVGVAVGDGELSGVPVGDGVAVTTALGVGLGL